MALTPGTSRGLLGALHPANSSVRVSRAKACIYNEAQAPTAEMAVTPPSIKKSAPTTYADFSCA